MCREREKEGFFLETERKRVYMYHQHVGAKGSPTRPPQSPHKHNTTLGR